MYLGMKSSVHVGLYKRFNHFFKLNLLVVIAVMFEISSFSSLHSQNLHQDQRPNILFAISDDQSFPHASAYGTEWVQTPAFDRVASEGVLFNRAYVPNPKCAPSRSIILTGRNSWQLEEAANHWPYFPAKFKVFPEVLAEHGYFVGATGKKWAPGVAVTDVGGHINPERDHVLLGKERHDLGRPYDWGYPIRGIIRGDMLYVRNFEHTRWPAGNPETGYLNTDGSPTKTFILNSRITPGMYHYWQWNFGKRPVEELYNIAEDPGCIHNLADDPEYRETVNKLKSELYERLKEQGDPRMFGRGYVFDAYPYSDVRHVNFYQRFIIEGEEINTGWVNESDYEERSLPEQRQ